MLEVCVIALVRGNECHPSQSIQNTASNLVDCLFIPDQNSFFHVGSISNWSLSTHCLIIAHILTPYFRIGIAIDNTFSNWISVQSYFMSLTQSHFKAKLSIWIGQQHVYTLINHAQNTNYYSMYGWGTYKSYDA